ncbi:MAG TPA: heme-copper oxidase subunit III [Dehalococcoidia bacterium]|nr:heme-copper oxidase subunit III [Dehalococcoidia bacterium]
MAAHSTAEPQGMTNSMLGFILFLASEIMFFGGLFAAYFIARADAPAWPPALSPEQIAEGVHLEIEILLPAISTGILVISSITIQWAVWQIQKGNQSGMLWGLFISLALGLIFLAAQLFDYTQLHFLADDTIYGTTFYTLTGFHGAHVAGEALFIGVVTVRALGGQFTAENHEAVEACSMYWHFVDVVWIALFIVLYIIK